MDNPTAINIRQWHSPIGEMLIGSYGNFLCICDWAQAKHRATVEAKMSDCLNCSFTDSSSPIISSTILQLDEYFSRKREAFDIPLLFVGTQFQRRVWHELTLIPYGTTISYGELAKRVGNPKAMRAAALACGRNPLSIIVPCHRVIGNNHSLTGYDGGLCIKKALLQLESPHHPSLPFD